VSDQGGGIPRSLSDRLFHYMYSTAPQPSKSDAHTVPLAGKYLCYDYSIFKLFFKYEPFFNVMIFKF